MVALGTPSDQQKTRFRSRLQDYALNCIRHLLSKVPYEDMTPEAIELPPRKGSGDDQRPPSTNSFSCPTTSADRGAVGHRARQGGGNLDIKVTRFIQWSLTMADHSESLR